jgi:hypothetical protein
VLLTNRSIDDPAIRGPPLSHPSIAVAALWELLPQKAEPASGRTKSCLR